MSDLHAAVAACLHEMLEERYDYGCEGHRRSDLRPDCEVMAAGVMAVLEPAAASPDESPPAHRDRSKET